MTYGRQLNNCSYVQVSEKTAPRVNWIYTACKDRCITQGEKKRLGDFPESYQAASSRLSVDFTVL